MNKSLVLAAVTLVFASYALRVGGLIVGSRVAREQWGRAILDALSTLILVGVMTASSMEDVPAPTGLSRVVGVTAALVLAARGRSIAITLMAAIALTAVLRVISEAH